jgi:hypothetical protein
MQTELFYESVEQALDAAIMACGGRKKIASEMWPDKPQRDAHNLMDACLNPERREKFAPYQVLFILRRAREAGFHDAKHYLDAETGYEKSTPLDPAVQEDKLAAAISDASRTLALLIRQAEALQTRTNPLTIAR